MEHVEICGLAALLVPDTIFTAAYEAQQASTEVVIYSRTAEEVVTIALPTHNGLVIVPTGLKDWLRNHGLIWECFCGMTSDVLRSCQIVVSSATGEVLAFCHYEKDKCGFYMNLTKKYRTALLRSSYSHLPTKKSGGKPAMDILKIAFKLQNYPLTTIAPYFEGYCGEHVSMYPGCYQLDSLSAYQKAAGTGLRKKIIIRHPDDMYFTAPYPLPHQYVPSNKRYLEIDEPDVQTNTRHKKGPALPIFEFDLQPVYGPRTLDHLRGALRAPSEGCTSSNAVVKAGSSKGKEKEIEQNLTEDYLARLKAGDGLREDEFNGLIEKCTLCGKYFLGKVLRMHILGCVVEL